MDNFNRDIYFPLVSICVPIWNGEKFIRDTLHSIETQTYPNLELVISDDSSNDKSLKLVNEFNSRSSIKYKVVNNPNCGIGDNWNNCIRHSSGKYIKFVFQDDLLFPECVEKMVALAEQDEKVGMVFSNRSIIMNSSDSSHIKWNNSFGQLRKYWFSPIETGIHPGKRILNDRNLFLVKPLNKIGEPSSILYRKLVFEKVGYFDTKLIQLLDIEFSLRVLGKFKFGYINENLNAFRLHQDQASNQFDSRSVNERILILRGLTFNSICKLNWTSLKFVVAQYIPTVFQKLWKFKMSFRG